MKTLFILLLVLMASVTSCTIDQKKEAAKKSAPDFLPPRGLDDDWSKWIVGEWEVSAESDMSKFKNWVKGKGRVTAELGLDGQFLIMKSKGEVTQISQEYAQYLKDVMRASQEDIENLRNLRFEDLDIQTIDPKTGQIIGYLFDSWRCVAKGTGERQGNKEIMEWKWSAYGQGTSTRVTEKVSDNRVIITEKYTLPDGGTMVDRIEMIRKE